MSNAMHQTRAGKEFVVLIPLEKSSTINIVSIERRTVRDLTDKNILHVGTGTNVDFIIYKNSAPAIKDSSPVDLTSSFKVFLVDKRTRQIQQENRKIRLWFYQFDRDRCFNDAQTFIKNLLKTDDFPRDYFSFIKRLMELFRTFTTIRKLQLEIETIEEKKVEPNFPTFENETIKEKILDLLEQAFPNSMSVDDLSKYVEIEEKFVERSLIELEEENFVKRLDDEGKHWTRVVVTAQEEKNHKVFLYKNVSEFSKNFRPTIAVITVNYFEKLAVDAMMEEKITFVRQKTAESNVYTIGKIGKHHVVSTKIPMIGRSRTAQISAGGTTTRLLGTFQDVEHVLVVGCAGAVPNFADPSRHPRRGDIVVGFPNEQDYVYGIFEAEKSNDAFEFVSTCFKPKRFELYRIVQQIFDNFRRVKKNRSQSVEFPWENFLREGVDRLATSNVDSFPSNDDRLLIRMEDGRIVEVEHPDGPKKNYFQPEIRLGMIGGGKNLLANEFLKSTLADKCNVVCFDTEIDQVLAAVQGNRIESFLVVRAISDYHDGSSSKEWQPFAALCAAAFMKTLICAIPNETHHDDERNNIV